MTDTTRLRRAIEPILERCLDFFGVDDLDPESSEAMPVVIKNRWVYELRAALSEEAVPVETTARLRAAWSAWSAAWSAESSARSAAWAAESAAESAAWSAQTEYMLALLGIER